MSHSMHVFVRGKFGVLSPTSFHHVGLGNQIQIIMFSRNYLNSLNHLTGPVHVLFCFPRDNSFSMFVKTNSRNCFGLNVSHQQLMVFHP